MRYGLLSMLLLAGSALAFGEENPRAEARAIVESAVKAHGGKAALVKAATFQRTGSGAVHLPGSKQTFTDVIVAQLPDRVRITVELEGGLKVTTVLDGKTGWKGLPGRSVPLPAESVAELQEEAYVQWIATLAPLLGDAFTLSPAGEAERNGKKCVGVQVAHKGHHDAYLWFDRESKLLQAIDKETVEGGVKLRKRYQFTDHKDFGGVKVATKLVESLNDRPVTEVTIKEFRALDRVDEESFGRP